MRTAPPWDSYPPLYRCSYRPGLTPSRRPTAANQRYWLYQHAWIVTGARFGWWHGAEALRLLIRVDRRVESRWGVGYRTEAAVRQALAEVAAKTK